MQAFRSYSTNTKSEVPDRIDTSRWLTAPSGIEPTGTTYSTNRQTNYIHCKLCKARVGRCKHIKYIVKSNSLALIRIQNTGLRMEIIRGSYDWYRSKGNAINIYVSCVQYK